MQFKRIDELKLGMRLAKPIYNKAGVLLYDIDSHLTRQGIESIKNFGLLGIYILEPAEPIPPMSEADKEFERFQTMCVFAIEEEVQHILSTRKQKKTAQIVADIIKSYGHQEKKVNYIKSLRSNEDYLYKHAMQTAILAAMLGNKLKLTLSERNELVIAAIVHDIGKFSLPIELVLRDDLSPTEDTQVKSALASAYSMLDEVFPSNPGVKRACLQYMRLKEAADQERVYKGEDKITPTARILLLSDYFDTVTSMRFDRSPISEVSAIKYLAKNHEIYHREYIDALIDCINILHAGVSVELTNGDTALIIAENSENILRPTVLNYRNNSILDLNDPTISGSIEIVDVMKTMDNRYTIDAEAIKNMGIILETP